MNENNGWISLHRRIQNHWIWQDPIKFQWWIDLLLSANIEDAKVNIGYDIFECKRGESVMSLRSWATRWKVSKDTVRNFFNLLERHTMIIRVNLRKCTRITICKYDDYQLGLHVKKTRSVRKTDTTPTQYNNIISKQVNNINSSRVFVPPSVSDVRQYFIENGYDPLIGEKAFKYYDTADWQDSKGNSVKNWKQKMQSVWFKEENKIIEKQKTTMVY